MTDGIRKFAVRYIVETVAKTLVIDKNRNLYARQIYARVPIILGNYEPGLSSISMIVFLRSSRG
jgi:hypothetical protein